MIATVVECDLCGKQLRMYGTNSMEFVVKRASEHCWEIGKKHLCDECKEKNVCSEHIQEDNE